MRSTIQLSASEGLDILYRHHSFICPLRGVGVGGAGIIAAQSETAHSGLYGALQRNAHMGHRMRGAAGEPGCQALKALQPKILIP